MATATIGAILCAVLLDETDHWDAEYVKRAGGKIFGLYWYDSTRAVHCCELTPSYELTFIQPVPLVLPEDHTEREELQTDLDEASSPYQVSYIHCASIDRIESGKPAEPMRRRWEFQRYTPEEMAELGEEGETPDEFRRRFDEMIQEYVNSNAVY